jgi:hypothetical protein
MTRTLRLIVSCWLHTAAGCSQAVGMATAFTFQQLGVLAAPPRKPRQRKLKATAPSWLNETREYRGSE